MKKTAILTFVLIVLFLTGCVSTETKSETILPDVKVEREFKLDTIVYNKPANGIKYSYFYYIPSTALKKDEARVMVYANANPSITYEELEASLGNQEINYRFVQIANRYGYILLVPVMPGKYTKGSTSVSPQYMPKEYMTGAKPSSKELTFFYRPDLEYIKIIDEFYSFLDAHSISHKQKLVMTGMSNGGIITNRISMIYPDRFEAVAIISAGIYLQPMATYKNRKLSYPVGLADINKINPSFSFDDLKSVHHFVAVGDLDLKQINDPIGMLREDSDYYLSAFGGNQVKRVPIFYQNLIDAGIPTEMKIYQGLAHQYTTEMIADTFKFFSQFD